MYTQVYQGNAAGTVTAIEIAMSNISGASKNLDGENGMKFIPQTSGVFPKATLRYLDLPMDALLKRHSRSQ